MKDDKSSITAICTAIYRAAEFQRPAWERICNDMYAREFLPHFILLILKSRLLTRFFLWFIFERKLPGVVAAVVSRVRYIDDYLAACAPKGIQQVVILGAGYDTRAYRFDLLEKGIRVFEVDHPETQRKKRHYAQNFAPNTRHVSYVPVNFENEKLSQKLFQSGYNAGLRTLFIWEGVTKYLSREAVGSILSFVTKNSATGSSIIFDYVFHSVVDDEQKEAVFRKTSKYQNKVNEPFLFGLEENAIEAYMLQKGYSQVNNVALHELRNLLNIDRRRPWPNISFGGIVSAVV